MNPYYTTDRSMLFNCTVEDFLNSPEAQSLRGKVQLIFTSPPFSLNSEKIYGNLKGNDYIKWLSDLAAPLTDLLTEDGSICIELGNHWIKGQPFISMTPLVSFFKFLMKGRLNLCQEFIIFNSTRLPLPTKWVCVDKIRCKDQFNKLWWMSRNPRTKTRLNNVLVPYHESTRQQIRDRDRYTDKTVPSGHIFKRSSMNDNGGAIPSSVLQFKFTKSKGDDYLNYCNANNIPIHPARMQDAMAEFFVKFLTDEGDIVLDPFAGSNLTGFTADRLGRRSVSIEPNWDYCKGSMGRWLNQGKTFLTSQV